jgi:hypothetical protein
VIKVGLIVGAVAVGLIALRKLSYPGPPHSSIDPRNLKDGRRTVLTVIAVVAVVLFMNHESCAQMVTQDKPIAYFLDLAPENLDISTLPNTARDIVVARVRLEGHPAFLGGRDQSGVAPPRPRYLLHARLKILALRFGDKNIGTEVDVTFGESHPRIQFPHTANQLNRDYHVLIYSDDDDYRHLAGFPVSEAEYQEWDDEVRSYERRNRPPTSSR